MSLSFGRWAVLLNVAKCYGWVPSGTRPPANWPASRPWTGAYDTSDGQIVTDTEAKELARILHAAAKGPDFEGALGEMIGRVEGEARAAGVAIPDQMRMQPEDFFDSMSPLLFLLYDGEFTID